MIRRLLKKTNSSDSLKQPSVNSEDNNDLTGGQIALDYDDDNEDNDNDDDDNDDNDNDDNDDDDNDDNDDDQGGHDRPGDRPGRRHQGHVPRGRQPDSLWTARLGVCRYIVDTE